MVLLIINEQGVSFVGLGDVVHVNNIYYRQSHFNP